MKQLMRLAALLLLFSACTHGSHDVTEANAPAPIYPDYADVTIPYNIAPLNFTVRQAYEHLEVTVKGEVGEPLVVRGKTVDFDIDDWHTLLALNKGKALQVDINLEENGKWKHYHTFRWTISKHPIDYGLTYRLIAPGYEVYSAMGLYRRELATFDQKALVENTLVPGMCVNCHTQNRTDATQTLFHVRGANGGTVIQQKGKVEMLDTKLKELLSACVYPYWHPGGNYVAFSLNGTKQVFHAVAHERVEVIDNASDIVLYDTRTHRLLTPPQLSRKDVFETFPVFAADGKSLYFCAAKAQSMPEDYKKVKYSLCRISFDPKSATFGTQIDTLVSAEKTGKSVTFPRPSYDGKYLMFTLADYGNFSIWHKEADLWLYDMQTGESRNLVEVNSNDTESFHNWSSNSHWFVFSSRRDDGLHTRLYLASFENGKVGKPFMLPQKEPFEYYDGLLQSYNTPDFINADVDYGHVSLEKQIKSDKRIHPTLQQ